MSRLSDPDQIAEALARPFDPGEVKFKPGAVSGNRALALAYVDARVIQDRLDEVLGVMGWQDTYECLPQGSVICRLKIRLGSEWIIKEDVGGQSEQPDEGDRLKAAFSDALKRVAVKFGIGRYLYRLKGQWVDYDPQKKQLLKFPALPGQAKTAEVSAPAKAQPAKAPAPRNGLTTLPPRPYDKDHGPDDFVDDAMTAFLMAVADSRNKSHQKLAERFGCASLGQILVKDYRFAVTELLKLPAVPQGKAS